MIIKSLSRRGTKDSSSKVIKYIFRYMLNPEKTFYEATPDDQRHVSTFFHTNPMSDYKWKLNLPKGLRLTKTDLRNLLPEHFESKLHKHFMENSPNRNVTEYVERFILPWYSKNKAQEQPFVIRHNIRGEDSIQNYIKNFKDNEANRLFNRKDNVAVHHTIISLSNQDSKNVTDAMLHDITNEYIRLRGEDNMYAGTVHRDRDHVHLHIAMSPVRTDGYSSSIRKKEFEDIKVKLQEYQMARYGKELYNSQPEHGKAKRVQQREGVKNSKICDRASDKQVLLSCIGDLKARSVSSDQFLSALKQNGFDTYSRSGKTAGVISQNKIKFRFTTLGINLDELNKQKAIEDKQMAELRSLREKERVITREIERVELEEPKQSADMQFEESMNELQAIRDGTEFGFERADLPEHEVPTQFEELEIEEDDNAQTEIETDNSVYDDDSDNEF